MSTPSSARRGFYLHTSWEFEYPFAVRSWQREDFQKFFALLRALDFNLLMFWPLTEAMPAPLCDADRKELEAMRVLADDARQCGLEFWATFCPNLTSHPDIAAKPFKERHLYPFRVDINLGDENAKAAYLKHRTQMMRVLNNADGYVTIDGDPGHCPNSPAREFLEVLQADRKTLNEFGTHPQSQKIVPWLWAGWGSDWKKNGCWNEPLEPLTTPLLELLKTEMTEPWELLPGRHIREGRGNGRTMFELAERAGLIEQSTLLCYEIIEYEPTPPAVVIQFDDIRRVLRQEKPLLHKARGVMGNAQQPIVALQNLYFFARAAHDANYLDCDDDQILRDFSEFLGGDAEVLVPAWRCLQLNLQTLPTDLPQRLRASRLKPEAARWLPGGAPSYLEILAQQVEVRQRVLRACATVPESNEVAARNLSNAIAACVAWWKTHRYVCSGEAGNGFRREWTHPKLLAPITNWAARCLKNQLLDQNEIAARATEILIARGVLTPPEAPAIVASFLD